MKSISGRVEPGNDERRRLVGLANRMLGTVGEAEDAVQEAFLRWYRLSPGERAVIENPAGWFTRVTSRICLDVLGSARARRECYVGSWLPEPVPLGFFAGSASAADPSVMSSAQEDPQDRVMLDESVSTALLVVLESMTPAERVAFVLHDVFAVPFGEIAEVVGRSPAAARQLAASARRRVRSQRRHPVDRAVHSRVVAAFGEACRDGNLDTLMTLLDPTVRLCSDGGDVVRAALSPITGMSHVARFSWVCSRSSPVFGWCSSRVLTGSRSRSLERTRSRVWFGSTELSDTTRYRGLVAGRERGRAV